MPRLKMDDDEFDIDELENAEYDDTQYERYTGEIPPKDTVLAGYIKNLWLTETQAGDRMIKVLFVADGNEDELEDYNGLPIWENLAMTAKSKFKWAPFFEYFGLTVKMFAKQTMLAEDDDNVGAPITKIGKWKPGEESPAARCAVVTTRERYNSQWSARIAEWVDLEEPEEEDEEEEEEAPPPPRRSARTASGATSKRASGKSSASKTAGRASEPEDEEEELEDEDEDEEELEEEEPEEEEEDTPPPPARTRRAASGTSSARPATKPAATSRSAGTKASGAKTSGTARTAAKAPARTAKTATRPARAKGRASDGGYDEEPPF